MRIESKGRLEIREGKETISFLKKESIRDGMKETIRDGIKYSYWWLDVRDDYIFG